MTPDYGSDLSADQAGDLDPYMEAVTGRRVLIEAISRRFRTPPGGYAWDSTYGLDPRLWLGDALDDARLAQYRAAMVSQCEQDERVLSVDATLAFDPAAHRLTGRLEIDAAEGPFTLVLTADRAAVVIREETG